MTPILVLAHGWGFDHHFWRRMQAELTDFETMTLDFGFFGAPRMIAPPSGRKIIAIGHSYGGLWFMKNRPFAWDHLIVINGFPRFVAGDDFPQGVPVAQVERMQQGLAQAPNELVEGFRQRCGNQEPLPEGMDVARLQQSLDHLRNWDCRPAPVAMALCGQSDKVVPMALSAAAFTEDSIAWHPGGHLLPQQDPKWCAETLRQWWAERA
jgi:pimeloyl-[acyl-carrier protein] methyl ester esterase